LLAAATLPGLAVAAGRALSRRHGAFGAPTSPPGDPTTNLEVAA